MNKQDYIFLFNCIYPKFFEGESIRNLEAEWSYDEMLLSLDEFELGRYDKKLDGVI